MAGRLLFWGKSEKTHDRLLRNLPPLTQKVAKSFQKLSSNLRAIRDHAEQVGKLAASVAKVEYQEEPEKGTRAIVATNTIAKTLNEPRNVMPDSDVAVYRSNIRSILGLQRSTRTEIQKLARFIRQSEDLMKQLEKFYPTKKQLVRARSTRSLAKSASPARKKK